MEDSLRRKLIAHELAYVDVPGESLPIIYNLYCFDIFEEPSTGLECLYLGSYYCCIKFDPALAKKYYLRAIDLGVELARWNLVRYYCAHENTEITRQFILEYLKNTQDISHNSAIFICERLEDYEQMKKYSRVAIAAGDSIAMNNLGSYYQEKESNFSLAKKYYHQAIQHNNAAAAWNLSMYYQEKKKYKLGTFYLKKSADWGYQPAIGQLTKSYFGKPQKKEYLLFGLRHQQTDLIIKHYQPKYVHYLLRGYREYLVPDLVTARREYLHVLFTWYQRKDTWFKHYCVKDVTGMIHAYLLQ